VAFGLFVGAGLPDRATPNWGRLVLEPGGRLVTIDPALVDGQHRIARLLVSRDRGPHVRDPDYLRRLVTPMFPNAEIEVRHDMLRPPYTQAIIRASLTGTAGAPAG
jgi:hypothetical protein